MSEPPLSNAEANILAAANAAGFRCFTAAESFQRYVLREVLVEDYPVA